MGIKKYKPTTPGRRGASVLTYEELTQKKPEKALLEVGKKRSGRSGGKISVRHRGGGSKRHYRLVDFKRFKYDVPAKVLALEYDPNRTAFIALVAYEDGEKSYILAPGNLKVGEKIISSREKVEIKNGNRTPLKNIPPGSLVYNLELKASQGGRLIRSAGSAATLMGLERDFAQLKMPSGEIRLFPREAMATIGQVSNLDHRKVRLGKAGRKRWRGIRPTVRGKALTPVDHPHGGGEGGSPIGLKHPKTPWGKPALGARTRKKKKKSNRFIIKRRK